MKGLGGVAKGRQEWAIEGWSRNGKLGFGLLLECFSLNAVDSYGRK